MQDKNVLAEPKPVIHEPAELIDDPIPHDSLVEIVRCGTFAKRQAEATRTWLAKALLLTSAGFVAAAAIISLAIGDWTPVLAVWSVAGPFFGMVIGHYFPKGGGP